MHAGWNLGVSSLSHLYTDSKNRKKKIIVSCIKGCGWKVVKTKNNNITQPKPSKTEEELMRPIYLLQKGNMHWGSISTPTKACTKSVNIINPFHYTACERH